MFYRYCNGLSGERRLAELMATEAARILKIPNPEVRFFRRDPEGGFGTFEMKDDYMYGFAQATVIAIRSGLSEMDILKTVIHEARHVWQNRDSRWRDRSASMREVDANVFELAWPRSDSVVEKAAFKKIYMTGLAR